LLHVSIEVAGDILDDHRKYFDLRLGSFKQPAEDFLRIIVNHALDGGGLLGKLLIWVLNIVFINVFFCDDSKFFLNFID
jgi:hypothetical protein